MVLFNIDGDDDDDDFSHFVDFNFLYKHIHLGFSVFQT